MTPKRPAAQRPSAIRTFLIADIRGYTRFTNELGDEAASRLAAKFAQVVAEGVEAWDGELVELRGDEALCSFESARQALRCAVELQEAFADETAAVPDLPLRVGIGLDAGEAVPIGDGYRGAAVNLASRLCSAAAAGEVLASASLIHLAGHVDGLAYAELDGKPLKGFDAPTPATRITATEVHVHQPFDGSVSERPALAPELDPIVPLVGRASELRWLGWHWRRARHGHGGLVVLSGASGMGRTRLAAELAGIAYGDGAAVVYVRGSGDLTAPVATALVVIDDVEALPATDVRRLMSALAPGHERRLVVLSHRDPASPSLMRLIERLVPAPRRRVLGALDLQETAAVARLYGEQEAEELPAHMILQESGGVPAAVHRVASQWARGAATRRLGATAQRTAAERRGLRAAESAMLQDLVQLERARERTRLYLDQPERPTEEVGPDVVVCPYKGLAAFEAGDADAFFGRERLIGELIARLVGASFVGLVGASGSGKSSALHAGLLPALAAGVLPASDRWVQAVMRPGDSPLGELRAALERSTSLDPMYEEHPRAALLKMLGSLAEHQRLLLIVDQFEELFANDVDADERLEFLDIITTERSGLKVVVAMRADHYEHAAAYPLLAKRLGESQVLVGPLQRDEIRAIIEHPATRVGLRVDPDLTAALVDDAGSDASVLPLLSTALLELWLARDGRRLTLAGYRSTGGLHGAVGRLAESAFGRLAPTEQEVARGVFLRLSGTGEGGAVVRRRVPLAELDLDRDSRATLVVDALIRDRLLVAGDGYAELAHEALLREWPRYRAWLTDDATGRQVRLHLATTAQAWAERGQPSDDLYRGARLAAALDWAAGHRRDLNATEHAFVETSKAEADAEAERQRRTNRRLKALLGAAVVFLLVAVGAGAFATQQAAEAERAAAEAERAAAEAQSRALAASAIASLDDNPMRARLLALVASSMDNPPLEALSALHQAHAADIVMDTYAWPEDPREPSLRAVMDPAGELIAASGENWETSNRIEVYEMATRRVLWEYALDDESGSIGLAHFSADGALVLAGSYWTPPNVDPPPPPEGLGIHVWDARTGAEVTRLDVGACGGIVVAVSAVSLLALTLPDPTDEAPSCFHFDQDVVTLELIDLERGERRVLTEHALREDDGAAAISADGSVVAYDDASDETTRSVVIDLETGDMLLEIDPYSTGQFNAYVRRLSADGALLLYGDRPVEVWDVALGEVVASYSGHAGGSWYGTFASADSVVTTGRDATLHHWTARGAEPLGRWSGLAPGMVTLADDGRGLVTDFSARTALVVDPQRRGEVAGSFTCPGFTIAYGLQLRQETASIVVACDGPLDPATTFILEPDQLHVLARYTDHQAQASGLSPDGRRIAHHLPGKDFQFGPIAIQDVATGEVLVQLEGTCEWDDFHIVSSDCRTNPEAPFIFYANRLAWSPDGTMLAGVSRGMYFAVWDTHTGALLYTEPVDQRRGFVTDAFFTPDGADLIVTYFGRRLDRISVGAWERTLEASTDPRFLDATNLTLVDFLDGSTFIAWGSVGDAGGGLFWVDVDTLAVDTSRSASRISEGSIKSQAMSPDRSLVAIGSSDGFVRVFDSDTGAVRHELRFGTAEIQGLAFRDEHRLIVAPQGGTVQTVTLDRDELLTLVRRSLSRGFSDFECQRFFPQNNCPTFAQLRGEGD
ncbi:MAG TPA: AAA family ATPase [Candidatus Limnocylindrales bacterium]|nr:AAA family ATPase [Candidatus Limnocylindrales bacterium]